jgi:two-component system OmpR family sensor kinase
MTLRLRLVLALVVLMVVGLGVFGVVTYRLYAASEIDRLDEQIDATVPYIEDLFAVVGPDGRPPFPLPGLDSEYEGPSSLDDDRRTDAHAPPGLDFYAELRSTDDGQVEHQTLGDLDDRPDLPDDLSPGGPHGRSLTVRSVDGSTEWRVLVIPTSDPGRTGPGRYDERLEDGDLLVVAFPMDDVRASLNRLVLIEATAAGGLLVVLAVGAWLVLRRGLRPLEQMASTARTLTAGELHTRVAPADQRSEVGQLGLALNTMLGRLEESFAQQEATEQRLRQFLADAAHELRTPLTSIQGFAELFRLGADQDQADLAVTLRRIEEDAVRMHKLVDDLLLLARLDQTRPVEREPVDLAVLAAEACSDAVAMDRRRSVTLDAPAPVVVEGDRDHLRQAIGNLTINAVRHTPAGTPIDVSARIEAGSAVVNVRDHGGGLDDEALAHAFDRFWQANPSRSEAGAGLGLSIVAAIAAEHGGTATAANATEGTGAVFALDLPLTPPPTDDVD